MRLPLLSLSLVFLLVAPAATTAQNSKHLTIGHALSTGTGELPRIPRPVASAPETLSILAAMVEFQPDEDSRTTGDGTFDLSTTTRKRLDPPPHNAAYFGDHLKFLENYYRKASDGKCIVITTQLPTVYRLPKEMKSYSPPKASTTNTELGLMMQDAWHTIDSATPGIPFATYDAFILFHAGAGRDIDLTSIYGYDPFPYDIPSLYVNLKSLKTMFGNSYAGIPVNGGTTFITNSMIIPETETRELQSIGGTSLLELGINGLIVASTGSHLGLPDLFDTKTGKSGIGRFGLMDGQSIFSWNGLFPPEPSAWEKYFLGWVDPITVPAGTALVDLPAVSLGGGEDTIYRVRISESEYFLIENRNRDARRDGAHITVSRNGGSVELVWPRDTSGFSAFNQDSLYGVVTDVDELDWSLPGGVSRQGEFFDGGLMIWHIDENVILDNYAVNKVNADPEHRGVDVEEADGSQDIGQTYGLLDPGSGSEDGTVLDFWFRGNTSPVRTRLNAFSPVSSPGSLSYASVDAGITINGFSDRGPRMACAISVGTGTLEVLQGFPKSTRRVTGERHVKIVNAAGGFAERIVVPVSGIAAPAFSQSGVDDTTNLGSTLFAWSADGSPIPGLREDGMLVAPDASLRFFGTPALFNGPSPGEVQMVLGAGADSVGKLNAWRLADGNADSLADLLFVSDMDFSPSSSPVVGDSFLAIGGRKGAIGLFNRTTGGLRSEFSISANPAISGIAYLGDRDRFVVGTDGGGLLVLDQNDILHRVYDPAVVTIPFETSWYGPPVVGTISSGSQHIAASSNGRRLHLYDEDLQRDARGFPLETGEIIGSPALADIDGDGQRDIVAFTTSGIVAVNLAGAMLDHFPLRAPGNQFFTSSPIVADVDGDRKPEIVAVTNSGVVCAYKSDGTMAAGFPLLSGPNSGSTPAVFYTSSSCLSCADIALVVASDDGYVYGWKTGSIVVGPGAPPEQPWPQYMRDAGNSGRVATPLTAAPRSAEFLPSSLAYNWPNPVGLADGNITHIRYFLGADALVTIKIFDLAGALVREITTNGRGGADNEVSWDVTNIQSGVYYARISAEGSGNNGSAVVKIAVVK